MDNIGSYIFQIWQETAPKMRTSRTSEEAADPAVQKPSTSDSETVFLRRKSNFTEVWIEN